MESSLYYLNLGGHEMMVVDLDSQDDGGGALDGSDGEVAVGMFVGRRWCVGLVMVVATRKLPERGRRRRSRGLSSRRRIGDGCCQRL
ncbi:hypothetical protein C1H46_015230 [Malus baccata]|uniref:Uncharacterized protein n=1 Tax=Malus baccata TaxID=106549 RepID=A0A540MK03_MALBA|nr:hypothetical protein C1H46_015230 [Malus baccata]